MSNLLVALICLGVSIFGSIALLYGVRRMPFARYLKETNDVVGAYIGIIGTLYSIVLALMFYAVWNRFDACEDICAQEASYLVSIHQLADGLSEPARGQMQGACRDYADTVIHKEWPAMREKSNIAALARNENALYSLLNTLNPPSTHDQMLLAQIQNQFLSLTTTRRLRLHKADADIPNALWAMLLISAVIVVAFSCLFGVDSFRLHVLKCSTLAATIGLVLFTIWAIDDPFQGEVSISPINFEHALQQFDRAEGKTPSDKHP